MAAIKLQQYKYKRAGNPNGLVFEGEFEASSLQAAKAKASKLEKGVAGNWREHYTKANTWVKTRGLYFDRPTLTLTLIVK